MFIFSNSFLQPAKVTVRFIESIFDRYCHLKILNRTSTYIAEKILVLCFRCNYYAAIELNLVQVGILLRFIIDSHVIRKVLLFHSIWRCNAASG